MWLKEFSNCNIDVDVLTISDSVLSINSYVQFQWQQKDQRSTVKRHHRIGRNSGNSGILRHLLRRPSALPAFDIY